MVHGDKADWDPSICDYCKHKTDQLISYRCRDYSICINNLKKDIEELKGEINIVRVSSVKQHEITKLIEESNHPKWAVDELEKKKRIKSLEKFVDYLKENPIGTQKMVRSEEPSKDSTTKAKKE